MIDQDKMRALATELRKDSGGRYKWYAMGRDEKSYFIDFNWEHDAERWLSDQKESYSEWLEREGIHIVKKLFQTELETNAAEAADAIDLLLAEVEALKLDALKLQRSGQMAATCTHNNVVAMQAAWIEWQYGEGAEGAMEWIENTLAGPGLIPEPDEPHYREAQAYFDANRSMKLSDEALDTQIAELSQQTRGSR